MDPSRFIPGDAILIKHIVNVLKAKGIFDEFRHECLADVDTKPSCQNLSQRVDGYTSKFLSGETWHLDLDKSELRNKLRRYIEVDESGMLAAGGDNVIEQVIYPKIHQFIYPKILEVVHQYINGQTDLSTKLTETKFIEIIEKTATDVFESKEKAPVSDPVADILSFGSSKTKSASKIAAHVKTETIQHKHPDFLKVEKKERVCIVFEKSSETVTTSNDGNVLFDKEKDIIKKDEEDFYKKSMKDDIKVEKKKTEDTKVSSSEAVKSEKRKNDDIKTTSSETTVYEKRKIEDAKLSGSETPTSSEESKSIASPVKPTTLSKKDFDKKKHKSKSVTSQKSSNRSSEMKKSKKEPSDKSSEQSAKFKPSKSPKESSSSSKCIAKEEKSETSKLKSHDSSSNKSPESFSKKSKSSSSEKGSSLKYKEHSEKSKSPKAIEPNSSQDSSSNEKISKNLQHSSSHDSSQGSDQEKSSSLSEKKEKSNHYDKYDKKEKSEHSDSSSKSSFDKKRTKDGDDSLPKQGKNEKDSKLKLKDTAVVEAAKISSRSNSFGSTSSVSSSSNASKDNLTSTSDEVNESPLKDKKKKQIKEKDSCQSTSKVLPPPPPPPPPSSSLSYEITSSAEVSSMEDTQSSNDSDISSSEEMSEESSMESEMEFDYAGNITSKGSTANSSADGVSAFYDIFLYSSSSSEFEGYGDSPPKKRIIDGISTSIQESGIIISPIHTSELSSFEDELSSDYSDEDETATEGVKRRLTLTEAQELLKNRALLQDKTKMQLDHKSNADELPLAEASTPKSSCLSSDDEKSPSEPRHSICRKRKLNPRYASSDYTSIFNTRKETFITKQSSPSEKNDPPNSSPDFESKKKIDSILEKDKFRRNSFENNESPEQQGGVKKSKECNSCLETESQTELSEMNDSCETSIPDKIETIVNQRYENDNSDPGNVNSHLKPHNNERKLKRNSLKRKLSVTESSSPMKRPRTRSSVDSSRSELVPNENKPFNNEKQSILEEKVLNDNNLQNSDLSSISVKKDLFCKQRTNNNGDVLGQKDIFSKNSHGKLVGNSEKKTSESDTSKEVTSL